MKPRILFVCLGNICRSPLAEGILKHRLQQADLLDVMVDSAGTGGWHAGEGPDPRSVAVARRHGVDLTGQRARKFRAEDFEDFDWIFAMDQDNLRSLQSLEPPGFAGRLELMLDSARGGPADVPDPYYGGPGGFETVYGLLDAAAEALVDDITARA